MNKKIISACSVAVVAAVLTWSCGGNENQPDNSQIENKDTNTVVLSPEAVNLIGLKTEVAELKPYTGYITIPARVIANQDKEARVGSLIQGRAAKVLVKSGDRVSAGQVLMLVESLEIGEIKASYIKAKANLDFMKADYERHKSLFDQNIGSKQSYFGAKSEYEKALAEFNAEEQKIHSIGLKGAEILIDENLETYSGTLPVKSPIDGVIAERNVVIGQLVDGTSNAFTIINTNSVWIDGQIYESEADKIRENSAAVFTTSVYPDLKFSGLIDYLGRTIDEKTRTIAVRMEVSNPSAKLKPQMFGEMKIPAAGGSGAILVPSESVVNIDNADFVFIRISDSAFLKRRVTVGTAVADMVELRNGIEAGERVVVKGAFYLKSEMMKDELGEEE